MAISVAWESKPAGHSAAVIMCADRYSIPLAYCVAQSLMTPDAPFDVIVSIDRPEDIPTRIADTSGIRFVVLDPDGALDGLTANGWQVATYHRLLLPDAFAAQYGRILYLDTDVCVAPGMAQTLIRADMGGYPLAAAWDIAAFDPDRPDKAGYRNAGVILYDVAAMVAQDAGRRVLAYAAQNEPSLTLLDQDALNHVMAKDMAVLGPRWNYILHPRTKHLASHLSPAITHFAGPGKPWGDDCPRFRKGYGTYFSEAFERDFTSQERSFFTRPQPDMPFSKRLSRLNRRRKIAIEAAMVAIGLKQEITSDYHWDHDPPIEWDRVQEHLKTVDIP